MLISDDYSKKLRTFIDACRHSLDICTYSFTSLPENTDGEFFQLWQSVMKAAERNVTVRIIVDNGYGSDYVRAHNQIEMNKVDFKGIEIRGSNIGCRLHAKFVLFDQSACYLGSHNFTRSGIERNLELGIISFDNTVNGQLKLLFNQLWSKSGARKKSTSASRL